MKIKLISEVKVKGNKKDGWIIIISDNHGYKEDFALTHEEIVELNKIISKKLK